MLAPLSLLYLVSLVSGLSSLNLFSLWVFLELNLLVFVALMNLSGSNDPGVELKYFILQSLASSFFILSFFIWGYHSYFFFNATMIGSLLLKMGGAPFHLWLIQMSETLGWDNLFLVSTGQKILPLKALSLMVDHTLIWVALLSVLVGVLIGFSTGSLKKLFATSSVFSVSWLLAGGLALGFMFLFTYAVGFFTFVMLILSQRADASVKMSSMALSGSGLSILSLTMINFAGLPPFALFYWKVLIFVGVASNYIFCSCALLLGSLLFSFLYLRVFLVKVSLGESVPVQPLSFTLKCNSLPYFLAWGWLLFLLLCVSGLMLSFELKENKEICYTQVY